MPSVKPGRLIGFLGGLHVIEIYLQNKLDRYYLFKKAKAQLHAFIKNGVVELTLASDRLMINVEETFDFDETIRPVMTEVLKTHVIETKEEIWLLDIISNIFFYSEVDEQLQIMQMAKSILSGERLDVPSATKLFDTDQIIHDAFSNFLTRDCKFCYESFLTFRLKIYMDKLIDCVELAIDEYQLEQEYQNLVESFRYYLKIQESKIQTVHVVINHTFTFYDETRQLINEEKLEEALDREIIFEQGIPINEMAVSPLVSLAPKKIFLYCDDLENGVVQTIQNIFQERVTIQGTTHFLQNEKRRQQN